jgi:hypothetical protein
MPSRSRSPETRDRCWRAYQRKLGEEFDLAGKALTAAAVAALFAPLASRGVVAFPSPAIGAILGLGLSTVFLGIHLQAQAKPDE